MLIRFWFGAIHLGRPSGIGCDYDASMTLCLGWRGDVPAEELVWRRIYTVAWDWLPIRVYRAIRAEPRPQPAITEFDRLLAAIIGRPITEPVTITIPPGLYGPAIDSSRWTGRDRKFIGFGEWRRSLTIHRSTRRSLMHVYLTGAKERANPAHVLYVAPGATVPEVSCPSEWKNLDGSPKQFAITFAHGRASVDEQMGEWLVKTKQAQRTKLVRASAGLLGNLAATIAGR